MAVAVRGSVDAIAGAGISGGGYSRLSDYIRGWREQEVEAASKAYVPLSFELGKAFQFDWNEEGLLIGVVFHHMQVSHLKLCASRVLWVAAHSSHWHEDGWARLGFHYKMKTALDKVKKRKGRIADARFNAVCSHYLFDPDFCNVVSTAKPLKPA